VLAFKRDISKAPKRSSSVLKHVVQIKFENYLTALVTWRVCLRKLFHHNFHKNFRKKWFRRSSIVKWFQIPPEQACQIFLGITHPRVRKDTKLTKINQMAKNTNWPKNTKLTKNITHDCKIYHMAIKCTNIFNSEALQNLP
jgi:hypothetical protein